MLFDQITEQFLGIALDKAIFSKIIYYIYKYIYIYTRKGHAQARG